MTRVNGAVADHRAAYALLSAVPRREWNELLRRRFGENQHWIEPALDFLADCQVLANEHRALMEEVAKKKITSPQVVIPDSVEKSEWMTTAQAAKRLGISQQRVIQLVKQGKLEGEQDRPRGNWRVSVRSVNERVASQSAGS